MFDVVILTAVHVIVEYIYSAKCVVYFYVLTMPCLFFYNDLYLFFFVLPFALFSVLTNDKCGACDVLRLILLFSCVTFKK